MKNYESIQRRNARQIVKSVALIACLGFAWLSLPMANGQIQSVQKSSATPQVKSVHLSLSPVKLSATEIKTSFTEAEWTVKETSERKIYTTQSSTLSPIQVTSPVRNDTWEAGKEYQIKWSGAQNDVRIYIAAVDAEGVNPAKKSFITSQAPNTGTYSFRVPFNWVKEPQGKVYVETIDGKQTGHSLGAMNVYTQPVDMECIIVDAHLIRQEKNYLVYRDLKKWLEFNVLMRNKGIRSPVTINQVLVRFIKEPEGVVVYQEDWGFGGIYYHDWYRLPEPRKINLSSLEQAPFWKDKNINFESGSYRVEVEIDPQNQLGENQDLRYDNRDVQHFHIKTTF